MPRKQPKLVSIGYDGKFELGITEVVDPYEGDTRKTIPVAVNVKHDVILNMYSRRGSDGARWINEAQYRAGNRFLRLVEQSGGNLGLAVDPTREPVDGRGDGTGVIDQKVKAALELGYVRRVLGLRDFNLMRSVICSNVDLYSFAQDQTERHRRYIAMRFKDALTTLSIHWGYSSERKQSA
jgi:hypothetical protein